MFAAEENGKISTLRSEDVLTCYVFSLFRYLNCFNVPTDFLCHARNLAGELLALKTPTAVKVKFWPKFSLTNGASFREADVLLLLTDEESVLTAILIEAKLHSGLSNGEGLSSLGCQEHCASLNETINPGHQLADEYLGLTRNEWRIEPPLREALDKTHQRRLVYVTANHEMPQNDILEAISRFRDSADKKRARYEIFWVGWWHLHKVIGMELNSKFSPYSTAERHLLEDVYRALSIRGLSQFHPFSCLDSVAGYLSVYSTPPPFTHLRPLTAYRSFFD